MRFIGSLMLTCTAFAGITQAAIIDTFTRTDNSPVTDSLGGTEVSGYDYIERGNTAAQLIPVGTAEISNNQLLITGSNQTATPVATSNTGGAYLATSNIPDLRVGMDVAFVLVGDAPSGTAGANANKFNNTFLLMLRSRAAQNFGTASATEDGLIAIEFNPNADLLIREQRSGALATVISRNYFTNAGPVREPLTGGLLPATYGAGPFDVNRNGFLDADEPFHLEAELIGNSLKIFVNGTQYGVNYTVTNTAASAGQFSGIGLHKNRLGGANVVVSNILIDNLDISPIPEPASSILVSCLIFGVLFHRSRYL